MLDGAFGPYRIEELLGRGGMGEVYRAHDTDTDRRVALKVLPPHLADDAEYQERFRRECRAAARLREPHIVPIHRFGEIDGRLYLDMRLVEGTDLATWLKTHGAMAPDVAVSVISQIASALDAAHADGLVHRDVKPSNVLLAGVTGGQVDREVFAYLFDFGIARAQEGFGDDPGLTRAGTMPGSLAYIAPERFAGVEGDPRADVYSLACVLHQALTGRPPFEGDMATLMHCHLNAAPPRPSSSRPDLPSGLDQVVAQGMAKDPAQRTPSAGALAAAARAEIGGWRTDPASSGSTVAWGGSRPDLAKPPAPGTAMIPPGWSSSPQAAPGWNSGYASQPAYGQPAYGQPAYGQAPTQVRSPGWGGQPPWAGGSHPSNPTYHPPQPPPNKNRTGLIVAAVVAVLAVIGGGVAAVALSGGFGGGGTTPVAGGTTTPPVTTTPPTTTSPVPTSASSTQETDLLLAELPLGYGDANCDPAELPESNSIALVDCPTAPLTGTGPTAATFFRYASVSDMDVEFDTLATANEVPDTRGDLVDCQANNTNRANYTRVEGQLGGQIACFTDGDGLSTLIWTDEAATAIGYVTNDSGDAVALYDWWFANDFVAVR